MSNIRNYQRELEKKIEHLQQQVIIPRLLLHSCCAPCSSYVLEYLSEYFEITVLYYNPNIYPEEEYAFRVEEQKAFITRLPHTHPIHFIEGVYNPQDFYVMAKGLEQNPEGGVRCYKCYEMRLRETARVAKEQQFDFFTTTLSISPLKNAHWLNEIGERLGKEYEVAYLISDFKKKNGYKRSVELSKEYEMYRQNYCGCIYSMTKKC